MANARKERVLVSSGGNSLQIFSKPGQVVVYGWSGYLGLQGRSTHALMQSFCSLRTFAQREEVFAGSPTSKHCC